MSKVVASSVASFVAMVWPVATVSLVPRPSVVEGALPSCKMPSISRLLIFQVILDDDGDDGKEKEGSKDSKEVKIDGSSSSSSSTKSGASGDEDNEGHNKSGNPRTVSSEELGF